MIALDEHHLLPLIISTFLCFSKGSKSIFYVRENDVLELSLRLICSTGPLVRMYAVRN